MAVSVRSMCEADLPAARAVYRKAFIAFTKLLEKQLGVGDYVGFRFHRDPASGVVAEVDGQVVAACFFLDRGSISVLGPGMVSPELGPSGLGGRLASHADQLLQARGTTLTLGYTVAHSLGHVEFFGRIGFKPRTFNLILNWQVKRVSEGQGAPFSRFSRASDRLRSEILDSCDELTSELYPGMTIRKDIETVQARALGDTLIQCEGSRVEAVAVCHHGAGSEADFDTQLAIRIGAVRRGPQAAERFEALLGAVEAYASSVNIQRISAGLVAFRRSAYASMLARGARLAQFGVGIQRGEDAFAESDDFIIDEWR